MSDIKIKIKKTYRTDGATIAKEENADAAKRIFHQEEMGTDGNKIKEIIFDDDQEEEQISLFDYREGKLHKQVIQYLHDETEEITENVWEDDKLISQIKKYDDGSELRKIFSYNAEKQLTGFIIFNEDNDKEEEETYQYTGKEITQIKHWNGLTGETMQWIREFDEKGRLIKEEKNDEETGQKLFCYYDYSKHETEPDVIIKDKDGKAKEAIRLFFDENNRIIKQEVQIGGQKLEMYITQYVYNEAGNLHFTETRDHLGEIKRRVEVTYNDFGLPEREDFSEFSLSKGYLSNFTHHYLYEFHDK